MPSLSVDGAARRPPARFPAGSLKFRTVGFPEYGFKRLLHPKSASSGPRLKRPRPTSGFRPTDHPTRPRSSSRSSCRDSGYHESSTGRFLTSGYRVRRVLSTPTRSARLGATRRFRGLRLYAPPCPSRVLQAGPESFPAWPSYLSVKPRRRPYAGRAVRCFLLLAERS